MIQPQFLKIQFADSYAAVKKYMEDLSHSESIWQPPFGGNCVNWIMGHLVVSRCNFLMLLDVPSIWTMERCRRFIPGSDPVTGEEGAVPFESLLADFDRTQEQLVKALELVSEGALSQMKDEMTVAESLVFYHAHESHHAGQLEVLGVLIKFGPFPPVGAGS